MKRPKPVRERPTERATLGASVIVSLLVGVGFERPTAAWIALGVGLLPNVLSPIVDWWRTRVT